MYYLKELQIEKFHLISEPVKITFNKDFNYLIGKNGTGKTTLLEIIKSLFALNFDYFDFIDSEISIRGHFFNSEDLSSIYIEFTSNPSNKENYLRRKEYETLIFPSIGNRIGNNIKIEIQKEEEKLLTLNINKGNTFLIHKEHKKNLEYSNNIIDIFSRMHDSLQENNSKEVIFIFNKYHIWLMHNVQLNRFEEGLESERHFFKAFIPITIKKNNQIDFFGFHNAIVNKTTAEKAKITNFFNSFQKNIRNKDEYSENLILTKNDSHVIKMISDLIFADDIRINYHLKNIQIHDEAIELELASPLISIVLNNGSIISYSNLSFGEKRLFNTVYSMENCTNCFLLDEPVNGFHHDFIEKVIELSRSYNSQKFIANQNPLLLDYMESEKKEDFQSQVIFCRRESDKVSWVNPSDKEAEMFMEDYDSQFLPVSSILKNLDLW